ncbi:CENP-V/GFA domain-containing protein [Trichoderma simmonsii]|uniref:CENP-V/GFA domain-containing protein n=1 Tax=Trichoderma simmonsii TaxID=1491479 RepID=A0A8G0L479_9HYPO|nr:CENP-V/GFA domain-containing protein [Trichoderma simmonsii]
MPPSLNEDNDISVKLSTDNLSERLPKPPLAGRCQCPEDPVVYNIASEPHSLNVCYCHECQRQTGSAFALTLVVPSTGVKMENPKMLHQLRNFERRTESGGIRGGVFCSNCGVRLWHFDPAKPEWTSVKAGTLDQKVDFGAAQHIWTKRMLDGIVLPPKAEAHEEEPDSGPV